MAQPAISVRPLSAPEVLAHSDALATILLDCVEGGASVSFMAPLARHKAEAFWRDVAGGVARGERRLLVAEDGASGAVLGTAQLVLAQPENQPHRADVSKVLVRRDARKRGIGAALMAAIDDAARQAGKTLLVLDTASADAERLYERNGWTRVGTVPGFAMLPDGQPCDTIFFYKCLERDD